jgi:6-phosphogluconolactonase
MGEDGHVASLFPGENPSPLGAEAVYRAVSAPKPPPVRITLDYAAIQAARQVWVLVSGPGKEEALMESLALRNTPLARVMSQRGETLIFTDLVIPPIFGRLS